MHTYVNTLPSLVSHSTTPNNLSPTKSYKLQFQFLLLKSVYIHDNLNIGCDDLCTIVYSLISYMIINNEAMDYNLIVG